nr:hypothetical protein [Sphaerisporangium siamense]
MTTGPTCVPGPGARADDQALGRLREQGHELLAHGLLDQDPRRGGAGLTLVEEGSLDGPGHRRGQVGVLADDQAVLSAELHQGRGVVDRRRLDDGPAGARRAGEGDLPDAGVGHQDPALLRPAVHHRHHLVGEHLGDELADTGRRHRGLLAGLEHDGVAGREGRRQLAAGVDRRPVEGDDRADHPVRHQLGGVERERRVPCLAVLGDDGPGEEVEQADAGEHVAARLVQRLAVLPGLHPGDLLGVGPEGVGDGVQRPGTLGGRPGRPDRLGRGHARDRRADLLAAVRANPGDLRAVGGIVDHERVEIALAGPSVLVELHWSRIRFCSSVFGRGRVHRPSTRRALPWATFSLTSSDRPAFSTDATAAAVSS